MSGILAILLIAAIIALCGFFIWLFWTVAGILMEIGHVSQYGWPLQLVIFLILCGICGGIGARRKYERH